MSDGNFPLFLLNKIFKSDATNETKKLIRFWVVDSGNQTNYYQIRAL